MPLSPDMRARVQRNTALRCITPGCWTRREFTKEYCAKCSKNKQRHGSPKARALRRRDYREHLKLVRAVFMSTEGGALEEAVRRMTLCLDPGPERKPKKNGPGATEYFAWYEKFRLQRAGVSPRLALEHAIAIMVLAEEQPARFPTMEIEGRAIASALYSLVPYYSVRYWDDRKKRQVILAKRPAMRALDELGVRVRSLLYPFARIVVQQIRQAQEEENQRRARLPASPAPTPCQGEPALTSNTNHRARREGRADMEKQSKRKAKKEEPNQGQEQAPQQQHEEPPREGVREVRYSNIPPMFTEEELAQRKTEAELTGGITPAEVSMAEWRRNLASGIRTHHAASTQTTRRNEKPDPHEQARRDAPLRWHPPRP